LRRLGREYGEAIARDLDWSCVSIWLMHAIDVSDLRNPLGEAVRAVSLCRAADAARLGLPHHEGKARPAPEFDARRPKARAYTNRIAEETLDDWRKAGSPHFDQQRIKRSYQYLVSCPAFAKYVRPSAIAG
jgi:hypothetical protein